MSQSRLGDRCHFTPVSKVNFCSFPLAHVSASAPILQDLTCCRGPSHWESQCGTLCLLNKERRRLRNAATQWCYKNRNTHTIKDRTGETFVQTDSGGRRGLALIALLNISLSTSNDQSLCLRARWAKVIVEQGCFKWIYWQHTVCPTLQKIATRPFLLVIFGPFFSCSVTSQTKRSSVQAS